MKSSTNYLSTKKNWRREMKRIVYFYRRTTNSSSRSISSKPSSKEWSKNRRDSIRHTWQTLTTVGSPPDHSMVAETRLVLSQSKVHHLTQHTWPPSKITPEVSNNVALMLAAAQKDLTAISSSLRIEMTPCACSALSWSRGRVQKLQARKRNNQ